MTYLKPKSGRGASRAKTLAKQASVQDSQQEPAAAWHSHSLTLWPNADLGGWSWKTSQVYLAPTTALTSPDFSVKWSHAGSIQSHGVYLMPGISESPSDAAVCLLSQVLEPTAPSRFCLSSKASAGILRRATRRGKTLPPALQAALELTASGEAPHQGVRRLTPTECERLMGWPDGYTIAAKWQPAARKRAAS